MFKWLCTIDCTRGKQISMWMCYFPCLCALGEIQYFQRWSQFTTSYIIYSLKEWYPLLAMRNKQWRERNQEPIWTLHVCDVLAEECIPSQCHAAELYNHMQSALKRATHRQESQTESHWCPAKYAPAADPLHRLLMTLTRQIWRDWNKHQFHYCQSHY